ncbi:SHOCT domain-containing protein [Candidatus Pelagibacter bacterium]|nr:SHOCT domain-containing protein [Candidatus Pelagibacter bacterium]
MKKISNVIKTLLVFFIFLNFQNLSATNTWFSKNKTYSGEIKFKGLTFQLLDGDWQVANKYDWHIMGIQSDGVTLVQVENNTIKALFEISQLTTSGKRQALVSEWLNTAYFNGVTDGCYEKSEYYLVKFWQKGMSANCLRVRHIDVKKEMYNPDYKQDADGYSEPYVFAQFKHFIKKNNLEIPKILISHQHIYNSPFHGGRAFLVYVDRNPEFYDVGETLIGDENNSEYHKANLNKHLKKKKFVNDIIQKSFVYHKNFEKKLKVKEYQRLDLGISDNKKKDTYKTSIVSELEKLNGLLKSGAITKKEFEAAKKKLLK